ncbi:hypothetical protein Nepgr_010112 [Nepenthes gracilis]|uniref:Uncharacterized protein n=1 Tax=Nepenthes gracilis TaxID=150966 RepID=A0AAD3SBY7_NEPGR|nr:hypothetical protein Nepgr_010112 [Nepenthes gracilis]
MQSGILHSLIHLPTSGPWPSPSPLGSPSLPELYIHSNPSLRSHFRGLFTNYHHRRWVCKAATTRNRRFNFKSRRSNDEDDDYESSFRRSRPKQRRWWSDENSSSVPDEQEPRILEEVIDSIWIFKVFRSYGWMLPPIILSSLLVTGPKALLITLALPLGQSLLTLAVNKLWRWAQGRPKPKSKAKRSSSSSTTTAEDLIMEEEETKESQRVRKKKMQYQTWVDGHTDASSNNSISSSFGGWDELVGQRMEFDNRSAQKSAQTIGGKERQFKKGKLKRRRAKGRDLPLLLRLLVAIFPFLGSLL